MCIYVYVYMCICIYTNTPPLSYLYHIPQRGFEDNEDIFLNKFTFARKQEKERKGAKGKGKK
jgi:hypothetical protein